MNHRPAPGDTLEQSLHEYQALFTNAPVAIVLTADRKIQRHNPKFAESFGFGKTDAIGQPGRCLYRSDEEYFELGRQAGPLLSQGKAVQKELYMRRQDGSDFWVNLIGYVADPGDPARGTWWILEDRSDFKHAEDALQRSYAELKEAHHKLEDIQTQLLQSEKLASIGQLAAGVAHEINNPIGFVQSNLGALERYLGDLFRLLDAYTAAESALKPDTAAQADVERVKREIDIDYVRGDLRALMDESRDGVARVRRIVQDLKDFSRVDSTQELDWVDLHQGLDSTLNVVSNEIKYKADVVKEYGELPQVRCLPSQLNQVFMNLMVNAAHAIDEGRRGTITLRTGRAGEEVWVEVADTGCGIKPDNLKRIFDPFFTTKPVGKGTGLGLSLSYGIVQKHGGRIEVNSEIGVGTRFRVSLPIEAPEAGSTQPC